MTKPTLAEAMRRMERMLDGVTFNKADLAAWAVVKEAAERGAIDTEIYDEVREQLEELEDMLKPHMTENELAWARGIVIGLRHKREARLTLQPDGGW